MAEKNCLIEFFGIAGKLKAIKRQGWLDRGIPDAESVADHSFRLALLALVFSKRLGIDPGSAASMALVHDLPEAITGDISRDAIEEYPNTLGIKPSTTQKEKQKGEEKALKEMLKNLDKETAKDIFSLWQEYEAQKTKTARAVKELDRVEVMMQALEYKKQHPQNIALRDFIEFHKRFVKIKNPKLKNIIGKIMRDFEATEGK